MKKWNKNVPQLCSWCAKSTKLVLRTIENKAFINWRPTVSSLLIVTTNNIQNCLFFTLQLLTLLRIMIKMLISKKLMNTKMTRMITKMNTKMTTLITNMMRMVYSPALQGKILCSPVCTAIAADGACRANGQYIQYIQVDHRHKWILILTPLKGPLPMIFRNATWLKKLEPSELFQILDRAKWSSLATLA